MNKRARLTRRILREHRRERRSYHTTRERDYKHLVIHDFWQCPHCLGRRSKLMCWGPM